MQAGSLEEAVGSFNVADSSFKRFCMKNDKFNAPKASRLWNLSLSLDTNSDLTHIKAVKSSKSFTSGRLKRVKCRR